MVGWVVWIADCLVQLAHSSAQAVITPTLRDAVPERALRIAADVGRWRSGCASGVPGAVDWLATRLTFEQAITRCSSCETSPIGECCMSGVE